MSGDKLAISKVQKFEAFSKRKRGHYLRKYSNQIRGGWRVKNTLKTSDNP